jgi:DNA-binding SARP family transcriptional activator
VLGPDSWAFIVERRVTEEGMRRSTDEQQGGLLSSGLQVRLFGRAVVLRDDRPVPILSSKALELLCYLLLYRDRAHARDALSRLLWPDAQERLAKKYLRQTLWQLQTNLTSGSGPDDVPLLDVQSGRVRVSPTSPWWCDVDVVERAHHRYRDLPTAEPTDVDVTALEDVVALFAGDLLDGWGQDWCVRERDRLHLVRLDLLERLTDHCVTRGDVTRGLAHGNRLLQLDPAREVTHRQLMRLYAGAGDRTGALRQYRRCVQALATEFDLEPDAETVELYRRIRSGPGVVHPVAVPRPAPTVLRLDERLDEIAAALAALRSEVRLLVSLQRDDVAESEGKWEAG